MWWWVYAIIGFVLIWLLTMLIYRAKGRRVLFWVSSVLPFASIMLILFLILVIVLLPIIYIGLFIYAIFAKSYHILSYGRRIDVE